MNEFARAEAVNVDLREFSFDVREQVARPLHRKARLMTALHEDLVSAERDRFFDLPIHFGEGDDVCVGIFFGAVEGAELAINVADVRVVDVAIDDVSDDLVAATIVRLGAGELAATICENAEFFKRELVKS